MNFPGSLGRFSNDQRAVSAVVGFILVFGILVLLLTVYQAQIVPQQNAQTEFEHFEDSQNELIELRNSISTTGQADVSQFPSINLGSNYQTRLLTINPAPPVGTLQTSERNNITIANETHQTNVSSRFLVYEPGYNELQIGSTAYEHSVLYLDERDRENNVSIIEDQNLVKDGKVRITALQNSFQQQGTNRVTLELYPQDELSGGDDDFPEGNNLNVTIPTQLSDDEYWDDEFENEDVYDGVDIDAKEEGIHTLNLSVDEDNLKVNSVGIQLEPNEEPAKNTNPQTGNGEQEEEEEEGNNEGELVSVDDSGDSDGQELQFDIRNDGDGEITEITEITIEQEDDIGDPIESDGQIDPQVEIDVADGSDQDGELSVGSSKGNQITYDETYDFEEDSQGGAGSYASLSPSNEGTVIIGDFNTDDSDGWDRVEVINQPGEEEDDLLIITLAYQDEDGNIEESELYLDVEED